jgi:hypothetical protein
VSGGPLGNMNLTVTLSHVSVYRRVDVQHLKSPHVDAGLASIMLAVR